MESTSVFVFEMKSQTSFIVNQADLHSILNFKNLITDWYLSYFLTVSDVLKI